MAKKETVPERKIYVVIRSGRKKETHESWKYYSILDTLRWFGADRFAAHEAAKWCIRAEPGLTKVVQPDISLEIKQEEQK